MSLVGRTAPAVSGGMKLVDVPLRAESSCARKLCTGLGEGALSRPSGSPSGALNGEGTVMSTFGSASDNGDSRLDLFGVDLLEGRAGFVLRDLPLGRVCCGDPEVRRRADLL